MLPIYYSLQTGISILKYASANSGTESVLRSCSQVNASSGTAASAELFIGLQPARLQWAHSLLAAAAACLRQCKGSEGKCTWEEGGGGRERGWLTFNFYICQHHVGGFSICNSAVKAHRVCSVVCFKVCLRAQGLHLALWPRGTCRSEGIMPPKEGNSYSIADYNSQQLPLLSGCWSSTCKTEATFQSQGKQSARITQMTAISCFIYSNHCKLCDHPL